MRKMVLMSIALLIVAFLNCKAVTHNKIKEKEQFSINNYQLADQSQFFEKNKNINEDYKDVKRDKSKKQIKEGLPLTDEQPQLSAEGRTFTEGYKDAKWGMSKEQVKESFPDKKFNIRDELIWFSDRVAGEDANVIFDFINDRLYTVNVQIKLRVLGSQAYVFRFFRFERLLVQKYGEPVQKIRERTPTPYVSDEDAILMGWSKYSSIWRTPESQITLSLQGANYKLYLWIEYECIELAKEKEQRKKLIS
jgi:hypothetical protein